MGVEKVKEPLLLTIKLSLPLFCSTTDSDAASPETLPPTVRVLVEQFTATLVMLALVMVPLPLVTVHVWVAG